MTYSLMNRLDPAFATNNITSDLWPTDLSSWGNPLLLGDPESRTNWVVFPRPPLNLHLLHHYPPAVKWDKFSFWANKQRNKEANKHRPNPAPLLQTFPGFSARGSQGNRMLLTAKVSNREYHAMTKERVRTQFTRYTIQRTQQQDQCTFQSTKNEWQEERGVENEGFLDNKMKVR